MAIDFKEEIITHLAALKISGKMRPDTNAIYQLCLIFEQVTGDPPCLTCQGHLAKVHNYFLDKAKFF